MRSSGDTEGGRLVAPEMLWLFKGDQQSIIGGKLQPMLDVIWTLQYQIPGAICGFAGEVTVAEGLPGVTPTLLSNESLYLFCASSAEC